MKLSEKGFQKILVESNLCDSFEYSQEDFVDGVVLSIEEADLIKREIDKEIEIAEVESWPPESREDTKRLWALAEMLEERIKQAKGESAK